MRKTFSTDPYLAAEFALVVIAFLTCCTLSVLAFTICEGISIPKHRCKIYHIWKWSPCFFTLKLLLDIIDTVTFAYGPRELIYLLVPTNIIRNMAFGLLGWTIVKLTFHPLQLCQTETFQRDKPWAVCTAVSFVIIGIVGAVGAGISAHGSYTYISPTFTLDSSDETRLYVSAILAADGISIFTTIMYIMLGLMWIGLAVIVQRECQQKALDSIQRYWPRRMRTVAAVWTSGLSLYIIVAGLDMVPDFAFASNPEADLPNVNFGAVSIMTFLFFLTPIVVAYTFLVAYFRKGKTIPRIEALANQTHGEEHQDALRLQPYAITRCGGNSTALANVEERGKASYHQTTTLDAPPDYAFQADDYYVWARQSPGLLAD